MLPAVVALGHALSHSWGDVIRKSFLLVGTRLSRWACTSDVLADEIKYLDCLGYHRYCGWHVMDCETMATHTHGVEAEVGWLQYLGHHSLQRRSLVIITIEK